MYCCTVLYCTSSTPAPLPVNIGLPTLPEKIIFVENSVQKEFCDIFTTEIKLPKCKGGRGRVSSGPHGIRTLDLMDVR